MPDDGLDAEKIRLLNQWAEGLQHDERAEVSAAGRAILMLIDEVARLHVHLWDQQLNPPGRAEPVAAVPSSETEVVEARARAIAASTAPGALAGVVGRRLTGGAGAFGSVLENGGGHAARACRRGLGSTGSTGAGPSVSGFQQVFHTGRAADERTLVPSYPM